MNCPVCGLGMQDLARHLQFAHQETVVMWIGKEDEDESERVRASQVEAE